MELSTGEHAVVEREGAKFYFALPSHKQLVDLMQEKDNRKGSRIIIGLLQRVDGLIVDGEPCTAEKFRSLYEEADPDKTIPGYVFSKVIKDVLPELLLGEQKKEQE